MSTEKSDHASKHWTVDVSIDEHDGKTRARAQLRWRDQGSVGVGLSRLDPTDRDVAEIGDELAAARALSDLARRLMAVTAKDIEAITTQPLASVH